MHEEVKAQRPYNSNDTKRSPSADQKQTCKYPANQGWRPGRPHPVSDAQRSLSLYTKIEQTLHRVTGLLCLEGNNGAVTVGTRLFLPKTQVIQRHNQAPIAPAPTWNRQLLRPNHCNRKPETKPLEPMQCTPVT